MPTKITFARLPWELRHEIWRLAAESEPGIVHNLTCFNVYGSYSHEDLRAGVLQFPSAPTTVQPSPDDASYFVKLTDTRKNGGPASEPLANVCPEACQVVQRVHPSVTKSSYRDKQGKEHIVWLRPKHDLFCLDLDDPSTIAWSDLGREIPFFRGGVENIAFRVDPAWYRYEFVAPVYTGDSPVFWDSLTREGEEGFVSEELSENWSREPRMLTTIARTLSPSVSWIEKIWLIDTEIRRQKTWKRHHKGKKRDKGLGSRQMFYGNGIRFVEVCKDDPGWDFDAGHRQSQQKGYTGTRPTGERAWEKLKHRNALYLADELAWTASYSPLRKPHSRIGVLGIEKWP